MKLVLTGLLLSLGARLFFHNGELADLISYGCLVTLTASLPGVFGEVPEVALRVGNVARSF